MSSIAILYGHQCLMFRGDFTFEGIWDDPRGLTGSELGMVRIAQELSKRHEVVLYTTSSENTTSEGIAVRPLEALKNHKHDIAIAINEPDLLREAKADLRICEFWLNGFEFCREGFHEHVDLFVSPSAPHLRKVLEDWRDVQVVMGKPRGSYLPVPEKWCAIELGCDPDRYVPERTVPGRAVYISSPDRGLHHLLQYWPRIKRQVPHAELRIFYRLKPWIDGFKNTHYFPPIEGLRRRSLYIEDTLRRLNEKGGLQRWGIRVCDSVSRTQIEHELSEASVLAYPCDTIQWSEGFSCSVLEACAAGTIPVITDCDALGEVYRDSGAEIVNKEAIDLWADAVARVLHDPEWCSPSYDGHWKLCRKFAEDRTWARHVEKLEENF